MSEALTILEGLADGWEWNLSKYGKWYHCVIRNDGLRHEPCYTSQNAEFKDDILKVVQYVHEEYLKGENFYNIGNKP